MGTTPRGYRYPELSDPVDNGVGPFDAFKNLASDVDADMTSVAATTTAKILRSLAEDSIAIWELEAKVLAQDNGLADWWGEPFVSGVNRIGSRTLDGNGFPILGIWRNIDRDVGFMGLDDLQPMTQYLDSIELSHTAGVPAANGFALSPDKKWAVAIANTSMRVYPVNSEGFIDNTVAPAVTTLSTSVASLNSNGGQPVKFTPDGKSIIVLLNATPFIVAYAFNTATGVVGAAAANPAVLMTATGVGGLAISPNSGYVAIAGSETASPFFTVYAYNSTTNTWGAKSAAPASAPAVAPNSIAFDEAGTSLIISTTTPLLRAYAFNSGTGAIGAAADAAGTLTSLTGFVHRLGKVITSHSATPFIRGYTLTAGAWSAQWAAPAVLPSSSPSWLVISDGAATVAFYDTVAFSFVPQAYVLNAATFGAKVTPTNNDTSFSFTLVGIPWPIRNRDDLAWHTNPPAIGVGLWGDPAGNPGLTGQAITTLKTLAANASQAYILDSWVGGAGVTRQYDISLDNGVTWHNNIPIGVLTTLTVTPGTQLKVRITITRPATGVQGQIFWFAAWVT